MNPPTPPTDEDLAALREGKTSAACARIVERHGALVLGACRRVLQDEGMAEDAAQETFVLLVRKARSLPCDTSLAGWLYHAACRISLNHQRTAIRRRKRETSPETLNLMTPDTQPNPWTEIEPHLDEAMLTLPERQRSLVVQCYFQNQSQRHAAAALGCSESVVSRELNSAIEALRQFFTKRRIVVSSVALTSLLSTNAASATLSGSATVVSAMMGVTSSSLLAGLLQSKLMLVAAAAVGTATVATVGYRMAASEVDQVAQSPEALAQSSSVSIPAPATSNGGSVKGNGQGRWQSNFQYTGAMALDELKKQVLLEVDPEARYALLQKMGIGLSRAGFDRLAALGMDASVAPWRDTFSVLANRTDMFENYLMAWSNEAPMAALNWTAAQSDGGQGMRKQLLYALEAKQLQPEILQKWIEGLSAKSMKHEASLALESMNDPSTIVARMGTGDNEGFLVDLAMLQEEKLDWSAFGSKLASGKSAIVARAMRQALEMEISQSHLDLMTREMAKSSDVKIGVGAVGILKAARGDASIDYPLTIQLAEDCNRAGMSDFRTAIFQGWALANPQAAMQHAGGLKDLAWMRDVIRALPTLPKEEVLLSWMEGTPQKAKDIAIAALYGRTSEGSFAQMQKIMDSEFIGDQMEAAQEVMRMAPLSEAAAIADWLRQLPAGRERQLLAVSLARRLAVVDPQTTLDFVRTEGLQGPDYDKAVSYAVTQFSARNDVTRSTEFIQQITDVKMYAEALGQLAMVKFPGRPKEAFAYLQAHSRGDWQPAALRMLTELYYNKLGNIDANAAEILNLDLQKVGPDAAKRTSNLCKLWIEHQVHPSVPLAWTQQLPEPLARQTRLQLARTNELPPASLVQFQAWAQSAAISSAEHNQLMTVLGKRLKVQVSR